MFRRRRDDEARAEILDRALHAEDLSVFDDEIQGLVHLQRALQPAVFQSEENRQRTLDRLMRAYRTSDVSPREDAGSRDDVEAGEDRDLSSVTLEHPDLGRVQLTDVEPIDHERAAATAQRLLALRARLAADAPRHSDL